MLVVLVIYPQGRVGSRRLRRRSKVQVKAEALELAAAQAVV